MVLKLHLIEIVMLFYNIQGVKFLRIQFRIVYLRHMMIVCVKVLCLGHHVCEGFLATPEGDILVFEFRPLTLLLWLF